MHTYCESPEMTMTLSMLFWEMVSITRRLLAS